jgi:probable F420-dependent oxidoreductase
MKVDAMVASRPLGEVQALARDAQAAGLSGLVITEAGRTAYLSCAAAALASDLHLSTGIAVAFPRSPMVTAQAAWELAEATGGRFRLGLGTQVRAHSERRYSAPFDPPGPRLRDYVEAVRACFRAFAGDESLSHAGDYYNLSLLPDLWSPGPIDHPPPPIDIAAVNPWMLRMANEVADGVHVHPLNTPMYLAETVRPNARDVDLLVPCFAVPGDTEEERRTWRHMARMQVAFYGSTPNYAFIFEQLGDPDVTPRLRERQKSGDIAGMGAVITDELLEHFIVESPWDGLADRLIERYDGIATRLIVYFAALAWDRDRSSLGRWGEVARDVVARTSGPPAPDADASDPEEL